MKIYIFIATILNILDQIEDEPLNIVRQLFSQQDDALLHNGRLVTTVLNEMFPNKWIGEQRPVQWPARSSDLNALDYFPWGNGLYSEIPDDVKQLSFNLRRGILSIPARSIQRFILKFGRLSTKCMKAEDLQLEHNS